MAERKQYKKSEESKRHILDATRRLAEEKGYDNTSMRDIAEESGLSVGAVYHHYSNKEAVMNESFRYFDEQLLGDALERYDAMDPLDAIKTILYDHAAFIQSIGVSLIREYYRALLNGKVQNAVSPGREYYRTVQNFVSKAQRQGLLLDAPPGPEITEYLVKSLRGAMIDWCLHDGDYDVLKQLEREIEFYLLPYRVSS